MFAIIVLPSALATEIVPEKDNEQLIAETLPANQISRGIDALVAKVRKDHQASEPQPAPAVDLESAADEIILLEKAVPETTTSFSSPAPKPSSDFSSRVRIEPASIVPAAVVASVLAGALIYLKCTLRNTSTMNKLGR